MVAVGPVERAVREDIGDLGDLVGIEPSLGEMAYTLAQQIDGIGSRECPHCGENIAAAEDGQRLLPQLNRELRQTLAQLWAARPVDDDDDDLGDLADPE